MSVRRFFVIGLAVAAAALVVAATSPFGSAVSPGAPHWQLAVLRPLPGFSSSYRTEPAGIDDDGTVVGQSSTHSLCDHAVAWRHGRVADLGGLGGCESAATAIDGGRIAGWADTGAGVRHAVVWERGRIRDLGTGGRAEGEATGFTSRGIRGISYDLDAEGVAIRTIDVLWEGGRVERLPAPRPSPQLRLRGSPAICVRRGIGAAGVIGMCVDATGSTRAYLWRGGRTTPIGGVGTDVHDLNAHGQVVGERESYGVKRPFVWQDGRVVWLPMFKRPRGDVFREYDALFVNARGDVAGLGTLPDGSTLPVLWRYVR